jgi:hypothetical protein
MGVKRLAVKLVGIFIVSSVYSDYLFKAYLLAKCRSFMPRKLAWHLVKVKQLDGQGVHFNCASRMLSVKRSVCVCVCMYVCMYAHTGEASYSGNSNSMTRILKNRETPLQFLGYMKNERRV